MIDVRTGKDLKNLPILNEPKIYIYLMLNDVGKLKIGKTRNIQKRYQSLGGSNGQGNKIISVFCSEETYVASIESTMHDKLSQYRIPNTEWFYDKYDTTGRNLFLLAMQEINLLFSSASYNKCNELRKKVYEEKTKTKGGGIYDN